MTVALSVLATTAVQLSGLRTPDQDTWDGCGPAACGGPHVARVLAKLGLRTRVHVMIYAYEHGLVAG